MQTKISNSADYNVALYIRLSKEDEGDTESQSIVNQRSLLRSFTEGHSLKIYNEYTDDGFSGTDFNRPAFCKMIKDIESGRVNMVITKDMSRLGRDYIMTGYYMERFFPENGVRYISLLDGIDSGTENAANDISPFRAVLNDMYAKDISKKIKSVKGDKQKKGLFIGGKAPYGYRLSTEAKNKIVVDGVAADIVRQIFAYAVEGKSCREIATILNSRKIPSPATYAKLTLSRQGPYNGLWSSEKISDILQNRMYIGDMVQGKTKKISYKSKKCVKLKREDWIVVSGTHEAIIETEVFLRAQALLAVRRHTRTRKYDYPLRGLIYCHECGYPLAVLNRPNAAGETVLYFVCRTYQRFSSSGVCSCHAIKEQRVVEAVYQRVDRLLTAMPDETELFKLGKRVSRALDSSEASLKEMRMKLSQILLSIDKMYLDKLSGALSEEDFNRIYRRLKSERILLEGRISTLERMNRMGEKESEGHLRELVRRFMDGRKENRELLSGLIERIELTEEKELIIYFRCSGKGFLNENT